MGVLPQEERQVIKVKWFVLRSAHAVVNGVAKSPCGRVVHGHVTETRPAGRSCETCLRAVTRLMGE